MKPFVFEHKLLSFQWIAHCGKLYCFPFFKLTLLKYCCCFSFSFIIIIIFGGRLFSVKYCQWLCWIVGFSPSSFFPHSHNVGFLLWFVFDSLRVCLFLCRLEAVQISCTMFFFSWNLEISISMQWRVQSFLSFFFFVMEWCGTCLVYSAQASQKSLTTQKNIVCLPLSCYSTFSNVPWQACEMISKIVWDKMYIKYYACMSEIAFIMVYGPLMCMLWCGQIFFIL